MKNRFSLVLICLFMTLQYSFAQEKTTITKISASSSVQIKRPIEIDSINIKGNKFTNENLLKSSIIIPDQKDFTETLQADTSGYFILHKPEKDANFQLFSLYVSSDRYSKGNLKIYSPNMFELYIDGKLEKSKTSVEDSLKHAKDITQSLSPYPSTNRIVLKLLSKAEDKAPAAFKITFEKEKSDSLANFSFSETPKRHFEFKDVLTGKRVTNVRTSPQGKYVLITYQLSMGEKSGSYSYIDLFDIKTGKRYEIDRDNKKNQLNWMPYSNELLYYVSTEGEKTVLKTINAYTFDETILAENIANKYIRFAPDGKSFFYSEQDKGDEPKGDFKVLWSPNDRQPNYRNNSFIYRYDLATGVSQQLTYGNRSTWLNDISSDSKKILFSVSEEVITKRPFSKNSLFIMDLETLAVDTIWQDKSFVGGASFSPDDKQILISGSGEAFDGIGLNIAEGQIANSYDGQLFIMDLATKKIDPITKNFNPSIDSRIWNKSDNMIYIKATDKDFVRMYTYNPSKGEFTPLDLSEEVVRVFSQPDFGSSASYVGTSIANTTKAYLYDMKNKKSTLIADPYKNQLDEIEFGKYGEWNFTNTEGTPIEGRYYLPPSFDETKKYPLIVYYYGGTTPTSRAYEHNYPPHYYAALGYVVYVVQPSGAIGYGQEFSAMHVNAWGIRTAEDIIEGTRKFVTDHPYVNEKKIGCLGASYGGFMTMYLQTRTDIFAAAMSHAGISSISSYWGEGYWGFTYSSGASAHSYPWNNKEMYLEQSPLFAANKVKTPILLLHGMDDTNVPVGESIQFYTALEILGKPVEFVQVKGENHVISDPKRRAEWMNTVMAWFDYWLKDEGQWWKSMYPDSKTAKQIK